jgi:predicted DsbA family dithiol-disulfide isomerase
MAKKNLKKNLPIIVIVAFTVFLFAFIIATNPKDTETELTEADLLPLVRQHTYIRGEASAEIGIVAFCDYTNVRCKRVNEIIVKMVGRYPKYVKFAHRHFPSKEDLDAINAGAAAQIAGEQGKFWAYNDRLYEFVGELDEKKLIEHAYKIGLDVDKFTTTLREGSYATLVMDDIKDGKTMKLKYTPTIFINEQKLLITDPEKLEAIIIDNINEIRKINNKEPIPTYISDNNPNKAIIEALPTIQISYTDNGFIPSFTKAYSGQKVRWTNNTTTPMTFYQVTNLFPELGDVTLQPGESFEFVVEADERWIFKERTTKARGEVYIKLLE